MNYFLSFLCAVVAFRSVCSHSHPGHLKPLGSAGTIVNVEEINGEFPNLSQLLNNFILKSKPVVSRQVWNPKSHLELWQSDQNLENEVYGLSNHKIRVEFYRGDRLEHVQIPFGEFIERYKSESLILADSIPEPLRKYLIVPRPFQCDVVLEAFAAAIMLMNDVNTSPLFYGDSFDHFHCVFRGMKRFVLIDTKLYPDIRQIASPDKRKKRTSAPLNPERVDLDEYPALANIEYHLVNVSAGDCLFIPNQWAFQDHSVESTITLVYNLNHHQMIMIDANELNHCVNESEYDEKFTLDQIDWETQREPPNLKEVMMKLIRTNVQGLENWQEIFSKHLSYDLSSDPEISGIFTEFYDIVDVDGDGQVTMTEIEQISGAHLHHISNVLYEIAKIIHEKQKVASQQASTEDDEDVDEHHTDL